MKFVTLQLAVLLTIVACDGPTRIRPSAVTSNNVGTTTTGTGTPTPPTTPAPVVPGGTATTTGSSTGGSTPGTTVQPGFESCNTNADKFHAGIGNISICQSTTNELHIRMGFTTTDQSDGTCLVPLYKDSAGNSVYLGSAQCTKHNAGQISYGYVQKTRSGYTNYPVNGVMVLKYSGTTAFFQCMQAYDINYQSCKVSTCQAAYGANAQLYAQCMNSLLTSCDNAAKQYMANVCTAFRNSYPYIDIRTK